MSTNIIIGSGLQVNQTATFNSAITTIDQIQFFSNVSNFNVGSPSGNFYIYNANTSINVVDIDYSTNVISINGGGITISATSLSSCLTISGSSNTEAGTQIFFNNSSTIVWQIGPNFSGGRGSGVGLNDFLFDNPLLGFNQIIIQHDNPIVDINSYLNVNESVTVTNTLTAASVVVTALSAENADITGSLQVASVSTFNSQVNIVVPAGGTSGLIISGSTSTNAGTQIQFYQGTIDQWYVGPNYSGNSDFNIYNANLDVNMVQCHYNTNEVTINNTLNSNYIVCTQLNCNYSIQVYDIAQNMSAIYINTSPNPQSQIEFYSNNSTLTTSTTYSNCNLGIHLNNFYLYNITGGILWNTDLLTNISTFYIPIDIANTLTANDIVASSSISIQTLPTYSATLGNDATGNVTLSYLNLESVVVLFINNVPTWSAGTYQSISIANPSGLPSYPLYNLIALQVETTSSTSFQFVNAVSSGTLLIYHTLMFQWEAH